VVDDNDVIDARHYTVDYLKPYGALILANTNYDGADTADGQIRNCDDDHVNGRNDLPDIGSLKMHRLGLVIESSLAKV
jgi:hypothetical protein